MFKNIVVADKLVTDYCYAIGSAILDDLNLELLKYKAEDAEADARSWKSYVETTIRNKAKQGSSRENIKRT